MQPDVFEDWKDYNDQLEYYVATGRDKGLCIRKMNADPASSMIIELVYISNWEWCVNCRKMEDGDWKPPEDGLAVTTHAWRFGAALYECDRFAESYSWLVFEGAEKFARAVAKYMKSNGPNCTIRDPTDLRDLTAWGQKRGIYIHYGVPSQLQTGYTGPRN